MTSATPPSAASLHAERVSVSYGAARALDEVSLEVRAGEVHSVCGENGAGKSTLIRCLGGALRPTSGRVRIGEATLPSSVRGAEAAGVAVVHQEPLAFPDLGAADTMFMAREPVRAGGLWLDRRAMHRRAAELLGSLGEQIDTRRPVGELPLAQRQMVAIARALAWSCRFLILDEPTASLSARETGALLRLIRELTRRGVGVLFVSHRLEEVLALSRRVTVLRDGRSVGSRDVAAGETGGAGEGGGADPGLSRAELVRLMVGREVTARSGDAPCAGSAVRLEVRGLCRAGAFEGVTFGVRSGEIAGLGGLIGAGRSEVARTIAGVDVRDGGEVVVDGRRLRGGRVSEAIRAGVVLVPEERREQGLVLAMSIASNISMTAPPPRPGGASGAGGVSRRGFVLRSQERRLAEQSVRRLGIKAAAGTGAPAGTLSGGNQQKVLLAKWLAHEPAVLILDEPTRGVDVGAKAEIHEVVRELARRGAAVLLISSDLPELLELSHRILVMREGRLMGEVRGDEATAAGVLSLALSDAEESEAVEPRGAA